MKNRDGWQRKGIPIAIHGDAVACVAVGKPGTKSMDTISWASILSAGTTHLPYCDNDCFVLFAVIAIVLCFSILASASLRFYCSCANNTEAGLKTPVLRHVRAEQKEGWHVDEHPLGNSLLVFQGIVRRHLACKDLGWKGLRARISGSCTCRPTSGKWFLRRSFRLERRLAALRKDLQAGLPQRKSALQLLQLRPKPRQRTIRLAFQFQKRCQVENELGHRACMAAKTSWQFALHLQNLLLHVNGQRGSGRNARRAFRHIAIPPGNSAANACL